MVARSTKSPLFLRVLGLFSLTISIVNSQLSAKNATAIVEDDVASKIINEITGPSHLGHEDKMEARSEEVPLSVIKPSTRSVEWKNIGPLTRSKDSYLEALRHSRTSTDPREGIVAVDGVSGSGSFQRRKEQSQGPVYVGKRSEVSFDRDSFSMVPSDSYSLPTRSSEDFGGPGLRISYGPPQSQPPKGSYGPPLNDYSSYGEYTASGGAYSPSQQAYGSPAPVYGAPVPYGHGVPHGMSESVQLGLPSIDFSWPFALKLNAFTLAKILLKLVIFKMIVKFIAVICLLLFIPKLEIKKSKKGNMQNDDNDEDDEGRSLLDANSRIWDRLNVLTLMVNDAMNQYGITTEARSNSTIGDCSTYECRIRRAFERDQSWLDYEQLLQSYILEANAKS
ncbi:unnamed protein product [Xylocopa violacea]|uniref:Uncharacterized protein n=1 Tax=Xylocopa violacea TaxID=135666 RepID=A0ABP1NF06_XYLVO